MATPVKYSGQQNKEAMLYFLKVMLLPSSPPELHGLRRPRLSGRSPGNRRRRLSRTPFSLPPSQFSFWRGTVDGHLDPSLNGFFPTVGISRSLSRRPTRRNTANSPRPPFYWTAPVASAKSSAKRSSRESCLIRRSRRPTSSRGVSRRSCCTAITTSGSRCSRESGRRRRSWRGRGNCCIPPWVSSTRSASASTSGETAFWFTYLWTRNRYRRTGGRFRSMCSMRWCFRWWRRRW